MPRKGDVLSGGENVRLADHCTAHRLCLRNRVNCGQLKLFSTDRTLKAILTELRGEKPARPQPRREVIERLRQKGMLPIAALSHLFERNS